MLNLNKVWLAGPIVSQPRIDLDGEGVPWCSFKVAVEYKRNGKADVQEILCAFKGEDQRDLMDSVCRLLPGSIVHVDGSLEQNPRGKNFIEAKSVVCLVSTREPEND